jgi:hypothetical protein
LARIQNKQAIPLRNAFGAQVIGSIARLRLLISVRVTREQHQITVRSIHPKRDSVFTVRSAEMDAGET